MMPCCVLRSVDLRLLAGHFLGQACEPEVQVSDTFVLQADYELNPHRRRGGEERVPLTDALV